MKRSQRWNGPRAAARLLAAASACVLTACPPSTGRHRGDPADGATIRGPRCAREPVTGEPCPEVSAQCENSVSCPRAAAIRVCVCTAAGWACDDAPCSGSPDANEPDAFVDPTCPGDVSDNAACSAASAGLLCDGPEVGDCDGGLRTLSCACIAGTWTCDARTCGGTDGG